ncbi:MAG: hypothetical protein WC005_10880 [Candidatus Nanopelagicales bacterium]
MHIAIASFALKDGVTEEAMVAASDRFETEFVQQQRGIIRRIVVKDDAGYADIVLFEDAAAIEQVMEAEQTSEACAALFSLMGEGSHRLFEVIKTYG